MNPMGMTLRSSKAFDSAENLAGKCAKFAVSIRLFWYYFVQITTAKYVDSILWKRDDSRQISNCRSAIWQGKNYSAEIPGPASRATSWDVPPAVKCNPWRHDGWRRSNLTWAIGRTLLIVLHIQSARRPLTSYHQAGVYCEHRATGGCAIKCLPPYPGYSDESFFARRTSAIHSSCTH